MSKRFTIETEKEAEGRWIAEVLELPGCLVYGATEKEAVSKVMALALHVIADEIEHGEIEPDAAARSFEIAA